MQGTQGLTGYGEYYVSSTAPLSPNPGDRWLDSTDGSEYTYLSDGNSFQWVDTSTGFVGAQGVQGTQGSSTLASAVTGDLTVDSLYITKRYTETVSSINISSNVLTINLNNCNLFTCSLNSNINTLTISNAPSTAGYSIGFTLIFQADGTARSVAWPASIKWAGGVAPTITSTNGKIDVFSFLSTDNGTSWLGFTGGQNH